MSDSESKVDRESKKERKKENEKERKKERMIGNRQTIAT
jgi:hypothetical protein